MKNAVIVDAILDALETGAKTEAEMIAKCGELAQSQLLDFQHLRAENAALYRKVVEWCEAHPLKL